MKNKEEIIEEIKLNAVDIIFNREAGWSDKLEKIIDFWITKALTQTREETIREVIDKVRRHYDDLSILDFIENEERKLNKLKK